jgi:predicted 3-demethylubiquinone-9 3-methyltransferase (glyoxalase superfamily)
MKQKIVPNIWFNGNAEEAVNFYVSVFSDGKILSKAYYPNSEAEGLGDFQLNMAGKVLTVEYKINGMHFTAINAGPEFKFTEAVSFAIMCKDQAEIDYFWSKLSSQPDAEQCGWCKDKYGLSWQIVPENIEELMKRPNTFRNMMHMKKIVINNL